MIPIAETNPDVPQGNYNPAHRRSAYVDRAEAFLSGASSPRAVLEAGLETIAARDGAVQAFCHLDTDGARAAADAATARWRAGRPLSPIDGCPIGIKDTIDVRGMPSRQNSAVFDDSPRPYDAACVLALKKAGAVILGKMWTPELAMGVAPPTRNPYDLRRTAGASSSGCGAAVGADMVPVTIGNQTAGSLIRPSSYNANYGVKPSFGVLNVGGMHPLAPSQDHIGPMAGTLADAWAVTWEIAERAGAHAGSGGLAGPAAMPGPVRPARLAFLQTTGWAEIDDASRRAFGRLLARLTEAGVAIIDATSDDSVAHIEALLLEADDTVMDIVMYEVRWPLVAYMEAHGEQVLSEAARHRLSRGLAMSPSDYRAALDKREALRRAVIALGQRIDGFVTLASSGPAPFVDGAAGDGAGIHLKTGSRAFVSPWSMVGGPSMSLPLMAVDGMPLGCQIMAAPGADRQTFAVAAWMDQVFAPEVG